jgi:quinol monooxygenase YgiN|tara:strand:+ start:6772 stop:7053 length:282 start_codon:yes stop_codon:yes gene_type:complete
MLLWIMPFTNHPKPKEKSPMPILIALSLLITSELSIQTEKVEGFLAVIHGGLEISRNFSGNKSFDVFVDQEKPREVLFIEKWESERRFQEYYE